MDQQKLEEIEFFFPHMHITRSSLCKGDLVPLHLHGNKHGFVYILKGRCQIAHYSVVRREESAYMLELIEDKEYVDHEYTIVSRKNNAHSILALEDTIFLDAFAVGGKDGTIQQFLKIIGSIENTQQIKTEMISLQEANIPKHLLEKKCKEIVIDDESDFSLN